MIENFSLNINLFLWINNFVQNNLNLKNIFIFLAEYLLYFIFILFLFYFFKQIWRDKKIELIEFIIFFSSSLLAWIFTKIIKIWVQAERPFSFLKIKTLLEHENIFQSFPSGHSTLAFAFAFSVYLYNKKIGWFLIFLATLVAFGRVLVGVHYPLDILTGALISFLTINILGKYLKRKFKK